MPVIFLTIIIVIAVLLLLPQMRERLLEAFKTLSDSIILNSLRGTSGFGRELTEDGKAEQSLWREQRLRNLRGLVLRSKEAFSGQPSTKKAQKKDSD